jgi:hypothetical protein
MPLPVNVMTCGELEALSVMVTVPLLKPEMEGVNVMLMAQEARAASDAPQVFP